MRWFDSPIHDKRKADRKIDRLNFYFLEKDYSSVVATMKKELSTKNEQLQNLVTKLLGKQAGKYTKLADLFKDIQADPATIEQAKKDTSDDGYWGVEQTSDRILDFAKALTGGDPDKIEEMRDAFEKGFKQATDTWGDELPDISQRTYKATMEKFDKWAEEAAGKTTDPATDAAKEVAGTV